MLEARENTARSHPRKPGVRDTKTASQQARSMVHGNKPATHEGFAPGRIPELLLGVRFIGSKLLTGPPCVPSSKFSNLFITHYITRTSALLEPKIEVFFISIY